MFHRGGSSRVDNIQPLCSTHNRLKHRLQVAAERRFWKGRARMSPRPEAPNPYPVPNTPRLPGSPPPPGAEERKESGSKRPARSLGLRRSKLAGGEEEEDKRKEKGEGERKNGSEDRKEKKE